MWGLGFSRMVLENAIATNKRLWASGESNCDCVEREGPGERDRERESERKSLYFLTQLLHLFFSLIIFCIYDS